MAAAVVALAPASGTNAATRAGPLTRAQANAIALRVLKPQREKGPVAVFGLPRPLGANQSVVVASPKRLGYDKAEGKLPRLGARTWLYWEDLHYGARFTHPSRLLVVDDRTGRTQLQRISWYPLVDGVRSLFLRSRGAYQGARYKVFSNVKPVRRASRVAPDAAQVANALPQKAYAEDCILMAGL